MFDEFEAQANRAKRRHNWLGGTSLFLLIAALEFGVFKLIGSRIGVKIPEGLFMGMLVAGILPFVLVIFSRIAGFHNDWVLIRYKAERIRHWKFQQLLDGRYVESLAANPAAANHFKAKWDVLMAELDGGMGRMLIFVNERPFDAPFEMQHYADDQVFVDAFSIYRQYRLNLQLNWFTQEREHYKHVDQRTETAASTCLFLGALAAFAEGILHFVPGLADTLFVEPGLVAAGISLTLLSAGVRVYRSASGASENAERYQRLASQLGWHSNDFTNLLTQGQRGRQTQEKLLALVYEIERTCHGELVEFIRVARKSDYIL